MVYTSVSSKEVMAMVIRLTGVKDTSYVADLDEFIAQGMSLMRTKVVLSNKWADVEIDFHKGKTPCDCKTIAAIEWNGHHIPRGNSVRTADAPPMHKPLSSHVGTINGFEFVPQYYYPVGESNLPPQEQGQIPTQDLKSTSSQMCNSMPGLKGVWYDTELNYITLSIPNAKIRVHYRGLPVDNDGLPLIPDNGDYKWALYYFCRACMIGRGFEDKIFTYDKIMEPGKGYFEVHAARAMSSIRYPSVDSMEFKVNEYQRLIKDNFYFDNFFSSVAQERVYGYDEYYYNLSPGSGKTYPTGAKQMGTTNP